MKPFAMNLKDAKKVSSDGKTSTFELNGGHKMVILHSALPALQRKQIEKMPMAPQKLASGGEPDPDFLAATKGEYGNQSQIAPPGGDDIANNDPGMNGGMSIATPDPASPASVIKGAVQPTSDSTTTESADAGSIPNEGAPVIPPGLQETAAAANPGVDIQGAYNQGQRGISEQQDVESKMAAEREKLDVDSIDAKQQLNNGLQQNLKDLKDHADDFANWMQNNPIDPKHYAESLSTPQKVATAVGLFLGGLSTPFTHQGNPAAEFLSQQIDRDIDAQKSRVGQQKSIYEANQNLYHDQVLANNATRINMNDLYDRQVQQAADKLGTPAAKARADQLHSAFAMQNAGLLQQNAIRATVLHSVQQGGAGLDAIDLSHAGLMSPEQAEKEQASVNAQKTAVDATKALFTNMNKEQSAGNLANPQSYARVNTLKAELVNAVMNASASKRLTPESIKAEIEPLEISTKDTPQTRKAKLDGVLNIIARHADPTPIMSKYAPKSLPQYPFQQQAQSPQHKVGDIVYIGGQKHQITDAQGNAQPVK